MRKSSCTSIHISKYDDVYIELIEEFQCANKMELERWKGEFVRRHYNHVVNTHIPGRTRRQYLMDKAKDLESYRDRKRDSENQRRAQRVECCCGIELRIGNRSHHLKSEAHIAIVNAVADLEQVPAIRLL
jgi:hypothetical protein